MTIPDYYILNDYFWVINSSWATQATKSHTKRKRHNNNTLIECKRWFHVASDHDLFVYTYMCRQPLARISKQLGRSTHAGPQQA